MKDLIHDGQNGQSFKIEWPARFSFEKSNAARKLVFSAVVGHVGLFAFGRMVFGLCGLSKSAGQPVGSAERWRCSLYRVLDFARGCFLAEQTMGVANLCFGRTGNLRLRVFSTVQSGALGDVPSHSIRCCVAGQYVCLGRYSSVFYWWRDWLAAIDGRGVAARLRMVLFWDATFSAGLRIHR